MQRARTESGTTHLLATWGIAGFVLLACAGLIGLETSRLLSERSAVLAESRLDTANLTGSLIQQAELAFRTADAILIGVKERLEHESLNAATRQRLQAWFLQEILHSPQFARFGAIDNSGALIASTADEKESIQFSERDYFIYHRDHDEDALHIGSPVRDGSGWIIPVTRRFNKPDGSFGGVALGAIDPQYFQDFYNRLQIGNNSSVLLATLNRQILVRRPFVEANIGRIMSRSPLFEELKRAPKGTAEIVSSTDSVWRLNSYEQGSIYPIVVSVAQDVDELLAPWRQDAIRRLIETAGISGLILLIGAFAWRAARTLSVNSMTLRATNTRFDIALANMPTGLSMFNADGKLMVWNAKYLEIYGMLPEIVRRGADITALIAHRRELGHIDQEAEAYVHRFRRELNDRGKSVNTNKLNDGRIVAVTNTAIAGGGWIAIHEDITEQVGDEEALYKQASELASINLRFDTALSHMTQGLCMFDENRRLVVWNKRFVELYNVPEKFLKVGTPYEDIITAHVARGSIKAGTGPAAVKAKVAELSALANDSQRVDELADGRFVLLTRQPMHGGGWLSIMEDITERRRAEAEIVHLARHDALTGLANRTEFNERLTEASKRLKRGGAAATVMMLDLDRFKAVNDTLGHPAGDQLLAEVGRRLQSTIRETDVLARLGGDEFAIIQEGGPVQHEGAIALALRIIHAISEPFNLNGFAAGVGISIGIALAPEHGSEPEQLLKSADLALYDAKDNGRNDFRIYHAGMLESAHTQQSAEAELRDAIARGEFELHYQPVVDARTRQVSGVEALVRWRHPVKGLVAPDQFIPLAESTGLIVPLGEWVLQQACADAVSWPDHIKVAVNLSAVQFKKGNVFDVILCALVETGLAPERLELEITETSLLENQEAHLATIRQLKNIGVTIALDDFGTGYSSVTYLTSFPFDKIKVDRTFTKEVLHRRDCAAVVSSVLALARGLGTVTTVEGIETEQQFEFMRQAGADLVQGYLFGRPVPVSRLDFNNPPAPAVSNKVA